MTFSSVPFLSSGCNSVQCKHSLGICEGTLCCVMHPLDCPEAKLFLSGGSVQLFLGSTIAQEPPY